MSPSEASTALDSKAVPIETATIGTADAPPVDFASFLPPVAVRTLPNGLRVAVLPLRRSPVVATALAYRAGTRDEQPHEAGAAHFLEHMMFKGSERYGPGTIDRLTQRLGGSNNAFTSHELTLYYFTFAADRWGQALDIEADRMHGLTLDPLEVDSERRVILEEISLYEGEPWDALDERVSAAFFGSHPYGRPVLGTRASLAGLDADALRAVHSRLYRPSNATLVIVGDVDEDEAHDRASEAFARVPAGASSDERAEAVRGAVSEAPRAPVPRVERRAGELARLLVALPSPPADHPDHAALQLLAALLSSGRGSRLQRTLVDDGQLCVWVSAECTESVDPGSFSLAAELLPGVEPAEVERALFAELRRLVTAPPSPAEIARARQVYLADWLFGHERVAQRAFLVATALALFDVDHPRRTLDRLVALESDALVAAARRHLLEPLEAGRATVGWSLPRREAS